MWSVTARAWAIAALLFTGTSAWAQGGYHVLRRFTLGGEGAGWDYVSIDSATQRLFIARSTHVMVFDVKGGKLVGDIPNTPGVHAVALVPELGRGVTSNGKADNATIFDLKTLAPITTVKTGGDPDAILYETTTQRVFTFNGHTNDATAIDPATGSVVGTLPLGGRPEFAVQDGSGNVFVDVIDTGEVVKFDARKLEVLKRFPTTPGVKPSGLAYDAEHHRLFAACRSRHMIVLDSESGRVIAALPIGSGADGAAFDTERHLAFASNHDGTLTVVREETPDTFTVVENAVTDPGARTIALDRSTHLLYLPTADFAPGRQKPEIVQSSFRVLVVGR